jgi:hypothetical protein
MVNTFLHGSKNGLAYKNVLDLRENYGLYSFRICVTAAKCLLHGHLELIVLLDISFIKVNLFIAQKRSSLQKYVI